MKIALIAFGIWFLWYFFHRQDTVLRWLTLEVNNFFLGLVLLFLRALLYGYFVYALTAVYGSINRISTLMDIITILSARPSVVGGPGIIGVALGSMVALASIAARRAPTQPDLVQRRNVVVETARVSSYQSFVGRVSAVRKPDKPPKS